MVVFVAIFWREDYRGGRNAVTHDCRSDTMFLTSDPGFGVQSNAFGFIISWATNRPVVVEACTTLANPKWSPVATNTLTNASIYFGDPEWTNYPTRFYRIRSP